jgi:hypothetical protein
MMALFIIQRLGISISTTPGGSKEKNEREEK